MNDIILNSNTRDVCGKQKNERAMLYPAVSRDTFVNFFNSYISKIIIYMNKNIVKYLQGTNFSQLTLSKKTIMKNLGRETPAYLLCSHIQAENKLM